MINQDRRLKMSASVKTFYMNLSEDKLYIKVIAVDEIYNFEVEKFLNWNCLGSQNIIVSAHILKIKN